MPRRAASPAKLPSRRALLAGLTATCLAAPALAGAHDGAWRRILASGRIRFGCGIWLAQLPQPAAPPPEPVADPFHAALAARLAGSLGLRHSFEPPAPVFVTMQRLQQGLVDVALGVMLNRLTARQVMFTPPYAELETVILSAQPARRRQLADWRGLRLGLQEGFVPHLENLGFALDDVRPQHFASLAALEAALVAGALDGAITTNITARNLMARHPAQGLRIRTALTSHLHGAGMRFGEHELLRAISATLREARGSGTLATLFERHAGARLPPVNEGT